MVVGTPIGNLEDLSPRAAECLRDADLVACEDTRRTAMLLRHAGADARMVAVHRHNEAARAADLVERMRAGGTVVLVSDAGMPLVSDPGARAGARGDRRRPPGRRSSRAPSAVTAALAVSGLAGEARLRVPRLRPAQGRRAARRAGARSAPSTVPVVCFESPQRLPGPPRRARRGLAGARRSPSAGS